MIAVDGENVGKEEHLSISGGLGTHRCWDSSGSWTLIYLKIQSLPWVYTLHLTTFLVENFVPFALQVFPCSQEDIFSYLNINHAFYLKSDALVYKNLDCCTRLSLAFCQAQVFEITTYKKVVLVPHWLEPLRADGDNAFPQSHCIPPCWHFKHMKNGEGWEELRQHPDSGQFHSHGSSYECTWLTSVHTFRSVPKCLTMRAYGINAVVKWPWGGTLSLSRQCAHVLRNSSLNGQHHVFPWTTENPEHCRSQPI